MSISVRSQRRTTFKTVVVGERAVGKTSLAVRFVKGVFSRLFAVTVGIEFYSKVFTHGDEDYNLQIWDTAGQQSFKSLVRSFYNQAACIVITYCDPAQMQNTLNSYLQEITEFASEEALIFVVRTKTDLIPLNSEEESWLNDKIERHQIRGWMPVSAKNGHNVEEFFGLVGNTLAEKYKLSQDFCELVDAKKLKDSIFLSKEDFENSTQQTQLSRSKKQCCQ